MSRRVYMSEVSPYWPIERQRLALAAVLDGADIFVDRLDRHQRRAHQAASLVERERMTRQTSRRTTGEQVHVASLAVLAWAEDDLRGVLAAIEARGATLHTHDGVEAADHVAAWVRARQLSRLRVAASKGGTLTAERRRAEARAKCEVIRERWEMPTTPETGTATLLAEVGLSRNTVNVYLGGRLAAQAAYQRREKRRRRKGDE